MEKSQILVVEDESLVAIDILKTLESFGYEVSSTVSSGEAAIQKVEENKPDLVLMDITLKGSIDGVSTAQRIQARFDIPVVYLTAHSDDETVKRVIHSNPYGYIVKPFVEGELYDTIEKALDRHKLKRR